VRARVKKSKSSSRELTSRAIGVTRDMRRSRAPVPAFSGAAQSTARM
jgi:hypothetical protein